jgi:predicted RNA methylase
MPLRALVKSLFVPAGKHPRTVMSGPLRGLTLSLNLQEGEIQMLLGFYEAELHAWIKSLTQDIRTFVDVGAAHGMLTLYALARTEASTVLAFEPDEPARSELHRNFRLNNRSVEEILLSDDFVGARSDDRTSTLDSYASHVDEPCFVKLDVEGAEANVLHGATDLLAATDVRWIIETHGESVESTCLDVLHDHGYVTHVVDRAWWRSIVFNDRVLSHNRWVVAYRNSCVPSSIIS